MSPIAPWTSRDRRRLVPGCCQGTVRIAANLCLQQTQAHASLSTGVSEFAAGPWRMDKEGILNYRFGKPGEGK